MVCSTSESPHKWQLGSAHIGITPSFANMTVLSEVSLSRDYIIALCFPNTIQHDRVAPVLHLIKGFLLSVSK